jgi:hypothetical protein
MRIIALHGPKHSGKTTATKAILEVYTKESRHISFATPMKQMLVHILDPIDKAYGLKPIGMPWEEALNDEKFKLRRVPILGWPVRYLLQTLGTEWGRNMIDKSIWIYLAWLKIAEALDEGVDLVIVDDLRFREELTMLIGLANKQKNIELTLIELEVTKEKQPWWAFLVPKKMHQSDKPLAIERALKQLKPARIDYSKVFNSKDSLVDFQKSILDACEL